MSGITPYRQLTNGLHQIRGDFNEILNEAIAFAEVMAMKANCIEQDNNDTYYVLASGPIDEVITTLYKQIDKLERLKKQRDNQV